MNALLRCVALVVLLSIGATAQGPAGVSLPPVDTIVDRVQHNIESTWSSLPNFLCDERITSQELAKRKVKREGKVESVLRATRTKYEGGENDFSESREIKFVNGKPPANQDLGLPYTLNNGFTGALGGIFGAEYRRCVDFSIASAENLHNSSALLLTAIAKENAGSLGGRCKAFRSGEGAKYWLDPETMQVIRTEMLNPVHSKDSKKLARMFENFSRGDVVLSWSVDFSRVLVDGNTYWLPAKATSEVVSTEKSRALRYVAEYSNYHKFTVTTQILPDETMPGK